MTDTVTFTDRQIRGRASRGQWLLFGGVILAAVAIFFSLTGCAGTQAREHVLAPAVQLAWADTVKPNVDRGIAEAPKQGATEEDLKPYRDAESRLDAAIRGGDRTKIAREDWMQLRQIIGIGLQAKLAAGEIGENVLASISETIIQFDAALITLTAK